ncbi:MAG: hypothetical protein HUU50_14125 [Candidatus Brocadiae bacterium]|nr:hypothetical protein [Candidatus Brocadiia bacterium]
MQKEQSEIKAHVEKEEKKIISFWYTTLNSAHVFLYTYFFDAKESNFHEQIFNQAFGSKMAYYKLLFVNFQNPSLDFQDTRDKISVQTKEKKCYTNISLLDSMQKVPKKYFLFLKSFLNFEKIPIGYAKSYLIAFPESLKTEDIEGIVLEMEEQKYSLKQEAILKKSWQEYLEKPQENFWKKEGN